MNDKRVSCPSSRQPHPAKAEAVVNGLVGEGHRGSEPLAREEIVKTILEIMGGATVIENGIERPIDSADIDGALYHRREACLATERISARQSKQTMRVIRQLNAALRKANRPDGGLPEDLRLVLGLDVMIYHLKAYAKGRKPKPDAFRKRLAADYALYLCDRFGVKATTARTGKFCLVAAALFGDPAADLQYHCANALAEDRGKDSTRS
jgi:hypothetical protein